MIETYGHYLEMTNHKPGEHHFITMYLMPRLQQLPFLPYMPDWISPDGTKKQYGDIVYGGTKTTKTHLSIEVKISYSGRKLTFTAGQYNLQISEARRRFCRERKKEGVKVKENVYLGDPDILIAAVPQGVAVVPWERFRLRYLDRVFARGVSQYDVVPGNNPRSALPFPHEQFEWHADGVVEFNKKRWELWPEAEKNLLTLLAQACRPIWEQRRGPARNVPASVG